MNKAQKQVLATQLKSEEQCLNDLEAAYKQALDDINAEVKRLSGKEQTKSVVYQLNYQKALQAQVSTILDNMQKQQYGTLSEYLQQCYQDGYIGAMYGISSQGIPITMPIQQDQVVYAVQTDSKLSKDLYSSMGKYLKPLKKAVTQELSRGLASSMHWLDIARNIESRSKIGYSNAARIARTEGHRIQNAAKLDAMTAAKQAGADVVKQWDATLDGSTRKSHRKLDGQIREIDEPFEVDGHKAMAPGKFGRPEEDINCRCAVLERARWALDEDELETLKKRAEYFGLDKSKTFADYKKKYLKASKGLDSTKKLQDAIVKAEAEEYEEAKKTTVGKLKADLDDAVSNLEYSEDKAKTASGFMLDYLQKQIASEKKVVANIKARIADIESGKVKVPVSSGPKKSDQLKQQLAAVNAANSPGDSKELKKTAKASNDNKPGETTLGEFSRAKRFSERKDSYSYHFDDAAKVWKSLSLDERSALRQYTGGDYSWMNGMCRTGEHVTGGSSRKDQIIDYATSALEKTGLKDAIVVRRGTQADGVAAIFGVDMKDLSSKDVQSALVGQRVIERGFMSTGASESTGFSGIEFEILLPEGTKGIYAEPFSQYGRTSPNGLWDGEKRGWQVGSENEFLVQRNSTFEIVRIDSDGSGMIEKVVMRLVDQTLE